SLRHLPPGPGGAGAAPGCPPACAAGRTRRQRAHLDQCRRPAAAGLRRRAYAPVAQAFRPQDHGYICRSTLPPSASHTAPRMSTRTAAAGKARKTTPFDQQTYLRWFKEMILMRRFEEKAGQLYTMQKFGGV